MTSPSTDRRFGQGASMAQKAPCRLATTANITLSGLQSIDGTTTESEDRILVKDQTDSTENGIYSADSGDWTRTTDFDGTYDATGGTLVIVNQGTANSSTAWKVIADGAVDIGTDSIDFTAIIPPSVFASSAALISFLQAGTAAVTRTIQAKERDVVSVKDFGALGNGSTDDAAAIQAAFDAVKTAGGGTVFFPAGRYIVNSRLKIQDTYTNNIYIKLRGESYGNPSVAATGTFGSILVGQTSGILLDLAGGSNVSIEDMALISGATNPSTIGILGQRITASPYFTRIVLNRVGIGITPNAAANGGLGTFAIINKRGEHHHYQDCWFYADRPVLCDGSSVYATLISPDYAEAVAAGYTLSINYMDNCAFLASSGDCVELRSTSQMSISGYMLLQDGKSGVLLGVINKGIKIDISSELGAGTPLCLVRVASGVAYGLTLKGTTNISGLTAVRTVSASAVQGAHIELYGGFTAVFDKTTESGGTMQAAIIKYDSGLGHTVPNANSIYASVLMDGAGGLGAMDLRALNAPTVFNTGGLQPPTTTTGTDTTPVVTETYIAEIFVPFTTILTGVAILNGSLVAGNIKAALTNQSGVVVASTASTAASGTAAYQKLNFSSTYNAVGPEKYYVLLQCNNVGYRFRSHALGVFGASKKTGETYGTFTTISAPSTFLADLGPIASVY